MRGSQPKKHKAACDQCNASKVKCPGGSRPCQRCADSSQPCHYSLARRIGKPPGSKNRKTLERLRQAKEGHPENSNSGGEGGDGSIPQSHGSRNDGDGVLDGKSECQEGESSLDPLQMSTTTDFWPISRLINYFAFPDVSQFIPNPEQDFIDGDHRVPFAGGDRSVLQTADPKFPDVEGHERADSRRSWADAQDDCWNVCTRPCCAPTLTNRRISLHHQLLTSSSLRVPQISVCPARCRLARQNTKTA